MNKNTYDASFQIISFAGNSHALSQDAIVDARAYKFEDAESKLKEAHENYVQAHDFLFKIITKESAGETNEEVDMLIVHAQDHLTMAALALEYANEFVSMYKKFSQLDNLLKDKI